MQTRKHLLIIGCGYLGKLVARKFRTQGWDVSALTRSSERAREFEAQGIKPVVGDIMQPETLQELPAVDLVLYAVGFDRLAGHSMRDIYVTGLSNVLEAMQQKFKRWIYVSSTSVYGQDEGVWVDEMSDTVPGRENGQICLEAETLLRLTLAPHASELQYTILRLAGIYGPGRTLSRLEQLHQQIPLTGLPYAWLNLIHVDDAAEIVYLAANQQVVQPLYLVCDDEPVTRGDYYSYLAKLANAPLPVFSTEATGGRRSAGTNKRCNNSLVKESLHWRPTYANYRLGLDDCWNAVE